jgi:hypothetical protein
LKVGEGVAAIVDVRVWKEEAGEEGLEAMEHATWEVLGFWVLERIEKEEWQNGVQVEC